MNKYLTFSLLNILLVSLASRVIAFYFFADTHLVNEWYILVNNLNLKGVLGLHVVVGEYLAVPNVAEEYEVVLPSIFMPPLYAYFIFLIKYFFANITNYINVIIFFQILLSTFSVYIFFKIINLSENYKTSLLYSLIFSLIPINIYSAVQISSISIQIFLLVCFFYILRIYSIKKILSLKNLYFFSLLSGLLILLRGEFILFYFVTIIYFFYFYEKKIRLFFISIIIMSLTISPYLIRNYNNFETFVITKSFGYNLLKGNNPEFKVEGNLSFIQNNYNRESLTIKTNNLYEIKLDDFYKETAIKFIKQNPEEYLKNYFLKIFSFTFIDLTSSNEKYYNLMHIVPKIILSILSLFGGIIMLRKKNFFQYLSIYYFSNIFFFSIFFILPRYSLILLPVQILLSLEFVKFLQRKFFY